MDRTMNRLRVYLSSTYEDLQTYREAVFAALEMSGLEVARMEGYAAGVQRPLDYCLQDVAQSDIYVGLFAWRYGYVPPAEHGNPDGKSITELEYLAAQRTHGRTILFFAHPDTEAAWPERFRDDKTGEGDGGRKLKRFRSDAGTEKIVGFFRGRDDLATLVLAAIMRSDLSGRIFSIPQLPAGYVPRPRLSNAIIDSLIGDDGGTTGTHTLVQGAGGFGKTTLAKDACHQPRLLKVFPDGLLWTSLGEQPDLALILGDLCAIATGSRPAVAGEEQIGLALARALAGRRCLMVIDDVWEAGHLAPFLELVGPRLLVTTRVRTLAEQAGQANWSEVLVDEMTAGEATALLSRGFESETSASDALQRLANQLGCWPLLLELANARLRQERKDRPTLGDCIEVVTAVFGRKGVRGFDRRESLTSAAARRRKPEWRNVAVEKSVEAGLEFAEARFPGIGRKAAEIAILPENVSIPVRVLVDLWTLDRSEVEDEVLRPLDDLSLLRWDRQTDEIRLHLMIDRVLDARLASSGLGPAAVHRRLIDAWGDPHHLPHDYAWRWFGWHCLQANDVSRLQTLLFDFDWLQAKFQATDINALVGEFERIPNAKGAAPVHAREPGLQSIRAALVLSTHVLVQDGSALGSQLAGRLLNHPDPRIQSFIERAMTPSAHGPTLRPAVSCLTSPGGALLRTFAGHNGGVNAVVVLPDGRRALSGSADGTLKLWHLNGGTVLLTFEGHRAAVTALTLLSDRRALSGSDDHTLKLWDLAAGLLVQTLAGHSGVVHAVAAVPDRLHAISASADGTLKLWDISSGTALRTFEGHRGGVTSVAVLPDGQRALSGSDDRTLKLWNLATGTILTTCDANRSGITAVTTLPDGLRALSADAEGTLTMWDLTGGAVIQKFAGPRGVRALAALNDGQRALSGSVDETMALWDLTSGTMIQSFEGHSAWVRTVAVLPDGQTALSGSNDCTLKLWDLSAEPGRVFDSHHGVMHSVTVLPDEQHALSTGADWKLKLWDLSAATVLRTFEGHRGGVRAVAMLHDVRHALSASDDGTMKLWDIDAGAVLQTYEGHRGAVRTVALLPDGQRALSGGSDGTLKLWDVATATMLRNFEGHRDFVRTVRVLPGGERALSASADGTLKLWDLDDASVLHTFDGHDGVRALTVLADGQRAVLGYVDGTVALWDLATDAVIHRFDAHRGWVRAAIVLSGSRVISVGDDGAAKLWDIASGALLSTFYADASVRCVSVAASNRTVVTGNVLGRICVLRIT